MSQFIDGIPPYQEEPDGVYGDVDELIRRIESGEMDAEYRAMCEKAEQTRRLDLFLFDSFNA